MNTPKDIQSYINIYEYTEMHMNTLKCILIHIIIISQLYKNVSKLWLTRCSLIGQFRYIWDLGCSHGVGAPQTESVRRMCILCSPRGSIYLGCLQFGRPWLLLYLGSPIPFWGGLCLLQVPRLVLGLLHCWQLCPILSIQKVCKNTRCWYHKGFAGIMLYVNNVTFFCMRSMGDQSTEIRLLYLI